MSGDISVPCTLPWTLVRGEPKHTPAHWLDCSPLARDELGRFSSEDRDERAANIAACDAILADLKRFHGHGYVDVPPQKRGRGRPRKAA
jgi:hypothetical protein